MKRLFVIMLSFVTVLALTACNGNNAASSSGGTPPAQTSAPEPPAAPSATEEPKSGETAALNGNETETGTETETETNILIAYFTMPETDGVDAVSSASRVIVDGELYGNTQYLAQVIGQTTGGDLFAIETVQEYPGVHGPLLDFAKEEQNKDARPELATSVDNMDGYDVIFLGYPNWWADLPQPLYTFLEEYDLSGKTIIPFCPHGGSGFSRTISAIAELQPTATVITDGFTVSRNSVASAGSDVVEWVRELGY